jgi:hypothetical protein
MNFLENCLRGDFLLLLGGVFRRQPPLPVGATHFSSLEGVQAGGHIAPAATERGACSCAGGLLFRSPPQKRKRAPRKTLLLLQNHQPEISIFPRRAPLPKITGKCCQKTRLGRERLVRSEAKWLTEDLRRRGIRGLTGWNLCAKGRERRN